MCSDGLIKPCQGRQPKLQAGIFGYSFLPWVARNANDFLFSTVYIFTKWQTVMSRIVKNAKMINAFNLLLDLEKMTIVKISKIRKKAKVKSSCFTQTRLLFTNNMTSFYYNWIWLLLFFPLELATEKSCFIPPPTLGQ